jgi:hypothetical protein
VRARHHPKIYARVVAEPHAKLREVDWKALTAIRADSSRSISGLISATGFSHKRNGDRVRTTH